MRAEGRRRLKLGAHREPFTFKASQGLSPPLIESSVAHTLPDSLLFDARYSAPRMVSACTCLLSR